MFPTLISPNFGSHLNKKVNIEILTHECRSKRSMLHPERRAIAENFYSGSTLPLLKKQEKLIQVFLIL